MRHDGNVLVTGTVADSSGTAPPTVRLVSYDLTGRITNANGEPVVGAIVITRTQDRDFWTRSNPSNSNGYYTSFFTASDETADNPVLISVGVASGSTSYGGISGTNIDFARLTSSRLNIQLGTGTSYKISPPTPFGTAFYSGLMVGVASGENVVRPVSETWPDKNGQFSMVLPATARGRGLTFFEEQRQVLSSPATPGGKVDLTTWPRYVTAEFPRGLNTLVVPRR